MNKGKIVQIIGPVVDIEFTCKLPAIYNALTIEFTSPGAAGKNKLTLEVQQHLGDNWVRAVAMSSTEGLKRGAEVTDMGAPMANLPVVIFQFAMSPYDNWINLAWGGALLITLAVLALNILARVFFREKVRT